jgi:predicted O-linked N-acetylglucosamine transferase (SPINDLY family)
MSLWNIFHSVAKTSSRSPRISESHVRALDLIAQGNALEDSGQLDAALGLYRSALEAAPDLPKTHLNVGNALLAQGDPLSALKAYEQALVLQPGYAPAHYNCGNARLALMQFPEAQSAYEAALSIDHSFVDALVALGHVQNNLRQSDAAIASYRRALELRPDYAEAFNNLGVTYLDLSRHQEALECFNRAITLKPAYLQPYYHRALLHNELKDWPTVVKDFDLLLSKAPNYGFARGIRLHAKMHICDWSDFDQELALLVRNIEQGALTTSSFATLAMTDSARVQLMASTLWTNGRYPPNSALGAIPKHPASGKIRVAYFSMDFSNHPVSFLTAGLYETHNRDDFEIYAFSFGPRVRDEMRSRLESAFDYFLDLSDKTELDIAKLARHLGIDIAVDLAGHTGDAKTGIFAFRAAPIQVNYLGYPATMGATYIDYMIADHVTVPVDQRSCYHEKIVRLPCFQVNDFKRLEAPKKFSRQDLGLPSDSFVFCCFNHSYKITPLLFRSWMRILEQVPHGILFLYAGDDLVTRNLRNEAKRAGIDPERLIFGPRLSYLDNASRYLELDLFLDTHPFNAGTTASDALWAGLPVLTCAGEAFASRMAASLLTALELPELITNDLATYEQQAIALATQPDLLGRLKRKLQERRHDSVLCDTATFTRQLEQAYQQMHHLYLSGLGPIDLDLAN